MFNQASKEEINSFLARCRKLVYDGQLQLLPRVNLRELTRYGLMIEDVEVTITELSSENYFRGPEDDYDMDEYGSGDIWQFKKDIDNRRFYIKLKLVEDGSEPFVKCMSFHLDEPWRGK